MTTDPAPDETERVVVTTGGLFRNMYEIAMEERNAHREKLATALGVELVGRSLEELVDLAIPQLRPKIGDEGCTCTLPPSYEGPCSWCDIHGQPSVAFEQGVAEGENSGRIFERELRDLRTKFAATRAELDEARAELGRWNDEAIAALRAESAHRRDALHAAWAERDRLRVQLAELKAGRAAGAAEEPDGDHHYLSTACEHELHERCQLRCKFCATGCVCSCHRAGTPDYLVPGDHHDNVCERRSGHEWPFCRCKDRAGVHEEPDDTPADLGPLAPHPPPWPVDEP